MSESKTMDVPERTLEAALQKAKHPGHRFSVLMHPDDKWIRDKLIEAAQSSPREGVEGLEYRNPSLPDPHERYGPCDAIGPNGSCAECLNLYGGGESTTILKALDEAIKFAKACRDAGTLEVLPALGKWIERWERALLSTKYSGEIEGLHDAIKRADYDVNDETDPRILEAARLYASQTSAPDAGKCPHKRVDHNLECLDCDEPIYTPEE